MYDPYTLVTSVNLPIPFTRDQWNKKRRKSIHLFSIWHKERAGCSAEWSFVRYSEKHETLLKHVVARVMTYLDDTTKLQLGSDKESLIIEAYTFAYAHHTGKNLRDIPFKAYWNARREIVDVFSSYCRLADQIIDAHEVHTRSKEHDENFRSMVHEFAKYIVGDVLTDCRPWYKHPRWHIHHWRLSLPCSVNRLIYRIKDKIKDMKIKHDAEQAVKLIPMLADARDPEYNRDKLTQQVENLTRYFCRNWIKIDGEGKTEAEVFNGMTLAINGHRLIVKLMSHPALSHEPLREEIVSTLSRAFYRSGIPPLNPEYREERLTHLSPAKEEHLTFYQQRLKEETQRREMTLEDIRDECGIMIDRLKERHRDDLYQYAKLNNLDIFGHRTQLRKIAMMAYAEIIMGPSKIEGLTAGHAGNYLCYKLTESVGNRMFKFEEAELLYSMLANTFLNPCPVWTKPVQHRPYQPGDRVRYTGPKLIEAPSLNQTDCGRVVDVFLVGEEYHALVEWDRYLDTWDNVGTGHAGNPGHCLNVKACHIKSYVEDKTG